MSLPEPPADPGPDQDEMSSRYVIGRLLGRGGMGEVRLATDQRLLREVAVKTLITTEPEAEARFRREAQITGRLTHPNIPPIHDLGVGPDGLFFTMRALPGRNLWEIVQDEGPLGVAAGLQLFSKVCDAVGYAHARGVIHRDLKPANIVVGEHGEIYVIDWGLAKPYDSPDESLPVPSDPSQEELTAAGEVLGTPTYMSPEHAAGATLDPRSDIYALGAILYVILTGQRPFKGRGYRVLMEVMKGDFEPPRKLRPQIPWEVEQIVLRAMALERNDRYPDVAALLADIAAYQDGRMLAGVRYGPWRRLARTVSRYGAAAVAISAVLGGVAVVTTGVIVLYAVTLVLARDRALEAEQVAEARALEQQVALARLRARSGMPGVARSSLDDAVTRSLGLGLDPRPARFAASELDMVYPPPELVAPGEGARLIDDAGQHMAWLRDHELAVHDLTTGGLLRRTELPGTGQLRLERASEGGIRLVELDGTRLRGMDASTGEVQWDVEVDTTDLAQIRLSPDGQRLAVNEGGLTRFYTVPEGHPVGQGHEGSVTAMSTDGHRAALLIQEGGRHRQIELVRIVDVDTGASLGELRGAARWTFSEDLSIGVRAGGRSLEGVALDGSVLWAEGTALSPPFPAGRDGVAFMSDIGTLEVRRIRDGARVAGRRMGQPPNANTASLSVHGNWVSTHSDGPYRAWSLATLAPSWRAHSGAILSVAFSPDGQLAATTGWEGDLAIWDWRSRRELLRYRISERGVRSAAFSPDGRLVATVDREGQLRVANLADGTLGAALGSDRGVAMDVAWQSPADLVVLYEDGALVPWDLTRGAPGAAMKQDLLAGWSLSKEGDLLAVSGRDDEGPSGELWNMASGQRVAVSEDRGVAYGAAVAPDGRAWVVGRSDGSVLWTEDGDEQVVTLAVQRGPAMSLDFSPDGSLLAIGCFDGRVVVVDRESRTEVHTLEAYASAVLRVAFDPTGRHLLIAGDEPGTVTELDLGREARTSQTQLEIRFGEDVTAPDWLAAAERAELAGDWARAARALEAAADRGRPVPGVRLARARAESGDIEGALSALRPTASTDPTAAAWIRALERSEGPGTAPRADP